LSRAIDLYRAMDMTFRLPQAEAALAQVDGPDERIAMRVNGSSKQYFQEQ
jgi:hypothetical protein